VVRSNLGNVSQLWVFDGDDTLWFVEPLYDEARTRAAAVVARAGLDPADWESLERKIDVDNVAIYGVNPERFPTSCTEAYRLAAGHAGVRTQTGVEVAVRQAAGSVFSALAPVHPDAARVVQALRKRGPAVLLTKGDERIQVKRIADAGLTDAFDEVRIVTQKDEQSFFEVLDEYRVRPAMAWSIGNSLRSDINPALRVGMNAVWIDAHVWEFERAEAEPVLAHVRVVTDLRDVPEVTIGVPLAVG
jgi:putative hydrolase of the HAD superfamily